METTLRWCIARLLDKEHYNTVTDFEILEGPLKGKLLHYPGGMTNENSLYNFYEVLTHEFTNKFGYQSIIRDVREADNLKIIKAVDNGIG